MRFTEGHGTRARDTRGVSNVLGFTLIIGIIFVSVVAIATLGSAAITDTQRQSELERAEHTMTLLDSRTAMVALGSSSTQSLNFAQDSGSFEVRPNSGTLSIQHINYTDDGTVRTEEIFNKSLGAIVYINGDTEIAYQGGGVWRKDRSGESRMISPPEFHYRSSTLTLPIIRVTGGVTSGSSPQASVSSVGDGDLIFPNETSISVDGTGAPYDFGESPYHNPIRNGTVEVHVTTPYYEGWATYFRERTTGTIEVFDSNNTVHLKLESVGGDPGAFNMPLEGDALQVPGMANGHPISEFEVTLQNDTNFNNGHWSFYSTDGPHEFEMHIWSQGQCSGGSYNDDIGFSIYYYNGSTSEVREWQNQNIDPTDPSTAFDIDCSTGELTVDFTNTNTMLTYKEIDMTGNNNKWCFGEHIDERDAPTSATLDQHSVDSSTTYTKGSDSATMNFTVNHYMSRMGTDFELVVKDGPGNSECLSPGEGSGSSRVDESRSYGTLRYGQAMGAQFITFLHVTENKVEVDLD